MKFPYYKKKCLSRLSLFSFSIRPISEILDDIMPLLMLSFLLLITSSTGCAPRFQKDAPVRVSDKQLRPDDKINQLTAPEIETSENQKHNQKHPSAVDEYPSDNYDQASDSNTDLNADDAVDPAVKSYQIILDEALELCQVAQYLWETGELENALQSLDQAYALIIGTSPDDNPKMMRQKEDLRFLISKRVLEIYASRHTVVKGPYKAIPITINAHVQHEIDLFTKGAERNFFLNAYKRSGKYRPMIVSMLREAGLPEALSWLPLIESGFKTKALSPARALGMWQFIPSTGYKFGLDRDTFIDERMDQVKSTKAAIAYLKELHQIFGDWATVLAAYNCGEGRVLQIIRGQNVNYLDNFWDLYERLPRETARYVPRFLATLHIMGNLKQYELDGVQLDAPLEYETVKLCRRVSLENIAKSIDIPLQLIKELNPELRYEMVPEETYDLRIPSGKREALLAAIDTIPISQTPTASARGPVSYPPNRQSYAYHRVRPGQTLSTIAAQYRTSISSITRANNINKKNMIVADRVLKIPVGQRSISFNRKAPSFCAIPPSSHTVKQGDSLWIIANRYGTTVKEIQKANNLNNKKLHIGQKLKIPGAGAVVPDSTSVKSGKIYLVKAGDSPYLIARQHNMSLERLLKANRLNKKSKLYPGQKLYID